ncbi:MAG: hypothetical protein ACI9S8_002319 [Chlamydiales bacterium]|jgi:hypothetical protein
MSIPPPDNNIPRINSNETAPQNLDDKAITLTELKIGKIIAASLATVGSLAIGALAIRRSPMTFLATAGACISQIPDIARKFHDYLPSHFTVENSLSVVSLSEGIKVTISGSNSQMTYDVPIDVENHGTFHVDNNLVKDITRLQVSINGRSLERSDEENHLVEQQSFTRKVLSEILKYIPESDPDRSKKISLISRLLNASIGIDLIFHATKYFQLNPDLVGGVPAESLFLRNNNEYRIQLFVSDDSLIMTCTMTYDVRNQNMPTETVTYIQTKVTHNLLKNTATYKFTPMDNK